MHASQDKIHDAVHVPSLSVLETPRGCPRCFGVEYIWDNYNMLPFAERWLRKEWDKTGDLLESDTRCQNG